MGRYWGYNKHERKIKNNINSIQSNGGDITDPAIIVSEFNNLMNFTAINKQIEAKLNTPNLHFPNNFLKLFKNELSKSISLLANISFNRSMFPNILKIANVTPIFKNDDPALRNNYRAISLLSNIC